MDTLAQDVRHAFRLLRKSPGFTAIAVFTLALGIGLSTTVFTVYDSVAVRLLPVKDAGSLVRMMRWYQDGSQDDQFTVREFEYLRNQAKSFSAVIAASTPVKVTAQDHAGDDADLIQAQIVSADYFSMLGIGAQPGRTFLKEDRGAIETRPVAVVSHRFWRRRFLSDPELPGRSFLINGTAFVLIGVAPESFPGTGAPPMTPDVWIPLAFADQVVGQAQPDRTCVSRSWAGGTLA